MSAAILSCPGPAALPVIFVPGIMGSRLRNRRTGRVVWDPDNYSDWSDIIPGTSGNGSIARQMRSGAGGKRRSLVAPPGSPYAPDYLEVDPGRAGRNRLTEETVARGWGGVHQASYRSILMWLRYTASNGFSGVLPKSCTSLRYEVWAHPYNWTADNALSGQQLGLTVARAIRETTAKYAGR